MADSTLAALQRLNDAEFHALCDELLPRIGNQYFPVTPHGRNDRGQSIRGQPDSYVGNSAQTCRVAIQYTVQAASWWAKVQSDVEEAATACPEAIEIVVALPRDVDREGPTKLPGSDWHQNAAKAAGPTKLTIVSGRQISQVLDTVAQDLRLIHLGIPCSRSNFETLSSSLLAATDEAIARLYRLKRFVPERYVSRDADRRLFAIWQECIRLATSTRSSREKRPFIPIVADSGIGKTSLLARFAERSSTSGPVLLLLARDLAIDSEDSLTRAVLNRLQGSMTPEARVTEESAVAACFRGRTPLTVVLDGLDETGNAPSLQRAIGGWLSSLLGSSSVLVTSSRIDFWRACRDEAWQSVIAFEPDRMRVQRCPRFEEPIAALDPLQGIDIPGLFEPHELAEAWQHAGQDENDLWALPSTLRDVLRHPFVANSAIDLLSTGTNPTAFSSRTDILDLWVERRLSQEADVGTRITSQLLKDALCVVAKESRDLDGGWVAVDQLHSAPRFDQSRPPGPVVERLIGSGLLETRPQRSDQVRFASESVQDFFRAELTVAGIEAAPIEQAKAIATLSFSRAVSVLEPVGLQLAGKPFAESFLAALAEQDPAMAAVCLRSNASSYSADARQLVASGLARMQESHREADSALAVELLGRTDCNECAHELRKHWYGATPSGRMRPVLAHAAISHGLTPLVEEVYRTWWFNRDDYFVDLGPELAASPTAFAEALSDLASVHLLQPQDAKDYRRAVTLCGYLLDEQVVDAIDKRTTDAHPAFFESLCLLHIGSDEALELYQRLVDRYLKQKGDAEVVDDEYGRWSCVFPFPQKIGREPSAKLIEYAVDLISSDDKERRHAGCSLAGILYHPEPFTEMVRLGLFKGLAYSNYGSVGRVIGSDRWLELWEASESVDSLLSLLTVAADLRDPRIEVVLITALQRCDLRSAAAHSLSRMGSARSCPHLRDLLSTLDPTSERERWQIESVINALLSLRDEDSLDSIVGYMRSDYPDGNARYMVATRIAGVGSAKAEATILDMEWADPREQVSAMVGFGSRRCIERAVDEAKQLGRGIKWLLTSVRHCFMREGWSSNHLRGDVEIEPLLEYVHSSQLDAETHELLESLLDDVDGPAVTEQYAEWWNLRGTGADVRLSSPKDAMLSEVAQRELARRGDSRVLRSYLNEEVEECKKYRMSDFVSEKLEVFSKHDVVTALWEMLDSDPDSDRCVAMIELLGRVGGESDAAELRKTAGSHAEEKVANAAYESALRISDPLRLALYW